MKKPILGIHASKTRAYILKRLYAKHEESDILLQLLLPHLESQARSKDEAMALVINNMRCFLAVYTLASNRLTIFRRCDQMVCEITESANQQNKTAWVQHSL